MTDSVSTTADVSKTDNSSKVVDYNLPADVFWTTSARRITPKGNMRFRSFPSLSKALVFLADRTEPRYRCAIDMTDARFEGQEIEQLLERMAPRAAEAGPLRAS
jgi:hypothetical protein